MLALLRLTLGKKPDDPYERFFGWKHRENPFGTSPAWVAEADGQVVGYRTFLRWEFEAAGRPALRAVRAVDTATHPAYQGRGIFQRLTLQALTELADDGVDLVFNTPNDQSRPGYLKMGWTVVERLPVAVRPRGIGGVVRMARTARSRAAADLWSAQESAGTPALDALAAPGVDGLVAGLPAPGRAGHAADDGLPALALRPRRPRLPGVRGRPRPGRGPGDRPRPSAAVRPPSSRSASC